MNLKIIAVLSLLMFVLITPAFAWPQYYAYASNGRTAYYAYENYNIPSAYSYYYSYPFVMSGGYYGYYPSYSGSVYYASPYYSYRQPSNSLYISYAFASPRFYGRVNYYSSGSNAQTYHDSQYQTVDSPIYQTPVEQAESQQYERKTWFSR